MTFRNSVLIFGNGLFRYILISKCSLLFTKNFSDVVPVKSGERHLPDESEIKGRYKVRV